MDDWIPYEILDENEKTATVKFLNPYYSENNDHHIKSINIPFKDDGTKDEVLFLEWVQAQARGIFYRMKISKK